MAHFAVLIAASEPSTPTTTGADDFHMIQLLSVPWRGYPWSMTVLGLAAIEMGPLVPGVVMKVPSQRRSRSLR
jgi:hypothetical protein